MEWTLFNMSYRRCYLVEIRGQLVLKISVTIYIGIQKELKS